MAAPAPSPTPRRAPRRPGPGARRTGYVFAVLIDAAVLWLLHVWPGWQDLPFLTPEFADVLWLVDLSLWVGLGLNVLYLVRDPRWLTALGGAASAAVATVVSVRMWQVFPFDLDGGWAVLARVLLVLGIVATAIAVVVNAVQFVRALRVGDGRDEG